MLEPSRWLAPLATIALVAALASALTTALAVPAMDFWHFRAVPVAVSSGVTGNLYSRSGRENVFRATVEPHLANPVQPEALTREQVAALQSAQIDAEFLGHRGIETVATPFLFACFSLLSHGDYDLDQRTYAVVSVLAFFGSVLCLALLHGFTPAAAALIAGVLGLALEPLASELRVGNVNAVQLAMMAAFLWLVARRHVTAAGAVLGAATMFKPNLAVIAAVVGLALVTSRRWRWLARYAAGGAAGVGAGLATTWLYFGSLSPWLDWIGILGDVVQSERPLEHGNFSLSAILGGGSGLIALALLGAVCVALLRSRTPVEERLQLAVGCGVTIMLLSSRLVWIHYYLLAVPAVLLGLRRASTAWVVAVALLAFTRLPASAGPLASALAMNAGTLLLLGALGGHLLRPSAEAWPDAGPAANASAPPSARPARG